MNGDWPPASKDASKSSCNFNRPGVDGAKLHGDQRFDCGEGEITAVETEMAIILSTAHRTFTSTCRSSSPKTLQNLPVACLGCILLPLPESCHCIMDFESMARHRDTLRANARSPSTPAPVISANQHACAKNPSSALHLDLVGHGVHVSTTSLTATRTPLTHVSRYTSPKTLAVSCAPPLTNDTRISIPDRSAIESAAVCPRCRRESIHLQ